MIENRGLEFFQRYLFLLVFQTFQTFGHDCFGLLGLFFYPFSTFALEKFLQQITLLVFSRILERENLLRFVLPAFERDVDFFDPPFSLLGVETELVVKVMGGNGGWVIEEGAFFEVGDELMFVLGGFEEAEGGWEMFGDLFVVGFLFSDSLIHIMED